MAETEKIIFETEVKTGNSAASIKSVKAELRSLTNELAALEPGSAAFNKAAQRAGELKDKIEDAQMAVKAFNPEAKFQAFANVVGGVANGFAAAQGAMAIFGADSKELEQTMVKTQGAIALATGLNGLLGMKDQLIIMAGVIKTTVVSAFATMRAAIISTGIIGLVALIGTLVYQWYENKKATEAAAKALEHYQKIAQENQDLAIRSLKGRAKASAELANQQTKEVLALLELEKKGEITREERLTKQRLLLDAHEREISELKQSWANEDAAKENARIKERKEKLKEQSDWEDQNIKEGNERIQSEKDKDAEKDKQRRASLKESAKEQYEYESNLAKQLEEDKIKALQTTSNALAQFAQLAGEQTAIGKALGIASTTIDTYVAAQAAFKSASEIPVVGPFLAPIAAAAAIAAGMARVRAIMAVKVPGNSGGGSMPSMSGVSAPPPIVRPTSSTVNLGQGQTINTRQMNQPNQRVYVLESDITDTQKKVDSIRQKAIIK